MAQLVSQMRASYGFIERNFHLVRRYWGWEVVWLAYSIANALAITFIGAGMEAISGQPVDTSYLILFLLAGTLIWHFLSIVFDAISEVIAWERWEGTIEYTFMAPVPRITHMLGQTAFSLVYGLLHTIAILAVVTLFFKLDLSGANLGGSLLVLLAGSLSFIGLGIVASIMPLLFPERGAQMTHVLQATLLLISGVYYPVSVLPGWMQTLAQLSGGRIPPGVEKIQVTLATYRARPGRPVVVRFEGRAKIGEEEVVRTATPAEDQMQAFLNRHLVPARELLLT
ncbi:MAG: ABC transporter permease, partial [Anaerolineae bacterium]